MPITPKNPKADKMKQTAPKDNVSRVGTAVEAKQKPNFNRDYPLSPTFKSDMVAPTKKQTNKFPKGIAKGIVEEGISEAVSTFKQKK